MVCIRRTECYEQRARGDLRKQFEKALYCTSSGIRAFFLNLPLWGWDPTRPGAKWPQGFPKPVRSRRTARSRA